MHLVNFVNKKELMFNLWFILCCNSITICIFVSTALTRVCRLALPIDLSTIFIVLSFILSFVFTAKESFSFCLNCLGECLCLTIDWAKTLTVVWSLLVKGQEHIFSCLICQGVCLVLPVFGPLCWPLYYWLFLGILDLWLGKGGIVWCFVCMEIGKHVNESSKNSNSCYVDVRCNTCIIKYFFDAIWLA